MEKLGAGLGSVGLRPQSRAQAGVAPLLRNLGPTIKSRSAVHRAAKDLVMMMAMKTMMIMRMIRIAITSKMKRSRRSERF